MYAPPTQIQKTSHKLNQLTLSDWGKNWKYLQMYKKYFALSYVPVPIYLMSFLFAKTALCELCRSKEVLMFLDRHFFLLLLLAPLCCWFIIEKCNRKRVVRVNGVIHRGVLILCHTHLLIPEMAFPTIEDTMLYYILYCLLFFEW